MSVFGSIVSGIFGHGSSPAAAAGSPAAGSPAAPAPTTAATSAPPMTRADVEAAIQKLASAQKEQFDWKHSIVDLMKLLKLDSSLDSRKKLAQELGYTGALDGSANMNIWLHEQVMVKLAEGGGRVPDSLRA